MSKLCAVCRNECKENPQKSTSDEDCLDWLPRKEWLQKMESINPYWWVDGNLEGGPGE
jgi:hypothetical protein